MHHAGDELRPELQVIIDGDKKKVDTKAVQYKDAHPLCEKCDCTTRRFGGGKKNDLCGGLLV